MNKINDGGLAFPTYDMQYGVLISEGGMTLRDYFAAKALVGLLAEPIGECQSTASYMAESIEGDQPGDLLARAAYRLADAMIRARSKS